MPLDCNCDPLAAALVHKAQAGAPGAADRRELAAGEGWRVFDIVCTCGPHDRRFEERHLSPSISLVLSGTFVCRGDHGSALLSAGSLFLVNAGQTFECSHQHGEGDHCLSFHFEPELFERLAHDAGASGVPFKHPSLPPLRALARLTARARAAMTRAARLEEIALELAGAAVQAAGDARRETRVAAARHHAQIARVLHDLGSSASAPHSIAALARAAGMSPYHFLRTFKRVTGVTPHQWLLRARLRDAAGRLATSAERVTDIALDAGFEDLSNFTKSFRAEFGVSPRRYRLAA